MGDLKIPQTMDDITSSWLSEAIGLPLTDNLKLTPNVQDGLGFLSTMIRANANMIQNEDSSVKPLDLIIKLLPADEEKRGFVRSEKMDETEINFYKFIVPDILKIIPELESFLCKVYYSAIGKETNGATGSVLILEDLKPKGFSSIRFSEKFPKHNLQDVIDFMAKFHFAGRAIELVKGVELNKEYNFLSGLMSGDEDIFDGLIKGGFEDSLEKLMKYSAKLHICQTVKKYIRRTKDIIHALKSNQIHPCLIHADLWTNNILIRDGKESGNIVIIDWQLLSYKHPCFDLTTAIWSCLPKEDVCTEKMDEWLDLYYKMYLECCENHELGKKFGKESFTPWGSFEEFKQFFYTHGMVYLFVWVVASVEAFEIDMPRFVKAIEFLIDDLKIDEFIDKII